MNRNDVLREVLITLETASRRVVGRESMMKPVALVKR